MFRKIASILKSFVSGFMKKKPKIPEVKHYSGPLFTPQRTHERAVKHRWSFDCYRKKNKKEHRKRRKDARRVANDR